MKKIVSERFSNALSVVRLKNLTKSAFKRPSHAPGKGASQARMPAHVDAAPPGLVLGQLTIPALPCGPQTLKARLDRCLPVPHLHITDAFLPQSFPIAPDSVAGLADGAPVALLPSATLPDAVIYQLSAPAAAFALSMVGRVTQDHHGQLYVEALQPHGPLCRLRLEAGTQAALGEVVVASVEAPQGSVARIVGKLEGPQSALTGLCAIAADCGARFGHDPEATGHAWNIRQDQRCQGPGMTDVPFFTLDPKGTRVLDQAMHLERGPAGGYRLHYAIADGGALVPMGSPCDKAAEDRGTALYLQAGMPEGMLTALHLLPDTLTQDAGSLIEQTHRPALVVTVALDAQCNIVDCTAKRTVIRSLQQVSTQQVQWYYDNNMSSRLVAQPFAPSLALLREVGQKLVQRAKHRGATSFLQAETLAKPDLVASVAGDVHAYEKRDVEVSQYNGQISMLVNEAVASKLAQSGVKAPYLGGGGATRDDAQVRAKVASLGFPWPGSLSLDEYLASLPAADPRTVAIRHLVLAQHPATEFVACPTPHVALGLPAYTNLTAPLRRYQDMVVQRIVDAVFTGTHPVPYQDDASIAAVLTSANIGRERQRLINQRTHGVRTAAFLRPHLGNTLPAKVVACAGGTAVVEIDAGKIRLPVRCDPKGPPMRPRDVGEVRILAADVITRECQVAWIAAPAHAV